MENNQRTFRSHVLAAVILSVSPAAPAGTPNDPHFHLQWGLQNTGQMIEGSLGLIGADLAACDAWAIHEGSRPVVVAIVGTGVHPQVEFADRVLEGYVSPLAGGDPYSTLDTGTNGTRAAGIIAAQRDNALGIAGLHDRAIILPVRVAQGGSVTPDAVADGIRWAADQNADIILVLVQFFQHSQSLADAVGYAADRGCLVVAGAGHTGESSIAYPAGHDTCLAVAATNNRDEPASWSNAGPQVDLSAPGDLIWSTSVGGGFGYESTGNTFSSAAFVAGAAALLKSHSPQLGAEAIRDLLVETADDLGPPGRDDRFGAGRVNLRRALESAPPPLLRLEPIDPIPQSVAPMRTARFELRIADGSGQLSPGSPELIYRTAPGPFTDTIRLQSLGGDRYAADLPPLPCGTTFEFFLLAATLTGSVMFDPPGAPFDLYGVKVDPLMPIFHDDFETDLGWSSIALGAGATGAWTRVVPVGTFLGATPVQPAYDRTPDEGRSCFITGQHFGGNPGTNDVDVGPVVLTSPEIEVGSAAEVEISYWVWFHTSSGTPDVLSVEYSRNAGTSWEPLENITESTMGWERRTFRLGTTPQAGTTLHVRFSVADDPSDSLTEAGVDEFRVDAVICAARPGDADFDGDVDLGDVGKLGMCMGGPDSAVSSGCRTLDLDGDSDVDLRDARAVLNGFDPES